MSSLKSSGASVTILAISAYNSNRKQQLIADFKALDSEIIFSEFEASGLRSGLLDMLGRQLQMPEKLLTQLEKLTFNCVFSWWGLSTYSVTKTVHRYFSSVPVVSILGTYPNAYNQMSNHLETILWKDYCRILSGLIYYSDEMRHYHQKRITQAQKIPSTVVIEPQPASIFYHQWDHGPEFERIDDKPHVVFTGTTRNLTSSQSNYRKDAVGAFLKGLSEQKIHVYLQPGALEENDYLHYLPKNLSIQNGQLSNYLSNFDAHLVIYNEFNTIISTRVRCGLGTRYAFGQTFPVPMMVSEKASFARKEFQTYSIGSFFRDMNDLKYQLSDAKALADKKLAFKGCIEELTFENRYQIQLSDFMRQIKTLTSR